MDEEKFKLVLSAPVDKYGMTIKLTVDEGLHALHIKRYPNFTWYVFGVLGLLILFSITLLNKMMVSMFCIPLLVIILYSLSDERAINCNINKKTGVINYHRSGVLMTSFDETRKKYNISEVERLEIHRYIKGGRWIGSGLSLTGADKFQILLSLKNDQIIPLSSDNLDFGECQEFAERIRKFIGNEITIKALG